LRLALTRTASVVNGFNLIGAQGSTEQLGFIDETVKEFVTGTVFVTYLDRASGTWKNRSSFGGTVIEHTVHINLRRGAIVGSGKMVPDVVLYRCIRQHDIIPSTCIKRQSGLSGSR